MAERNYKCFNLALHIRTPACRTKKQNRDINFYDCHLASFAVCSPLLTINIQLLAKDTSYVRCSLVFDGHPRPLSFNLWVDVCAEHVSKLS
jgi:hypothetical protein